MRRLTVTERSKADFAGPPEDERAAAIGRAVAQAQDEPHLVPAEGGYMEAPVTRLPQELLVYRIDNGRILSELRSVAASLGTTVEALESKVAAPEVQKLLHGLLMQKATDPSAPIHRELQLHARQTDPLLIQTNGIVVNGNRRLAAMRDLLARDPQRYASFGTVTASVLPGSVSKEDIEYIEAALQMAPDLKLEYNWINRRLKLRRHSADLPASKIVSAYRLPNAERIGEELEELRLAEEYLQWIGRAEDYARIEEDEARFAALRRQVGQANPEHLADLWKLVGFAMIASADRLEQPIEHYYPFSDPIPAAMRKWPLRAFAYERGQLSAEKFRENKSVKPRLAAGLRPLLDDPPKAEETARAMMGHIDVLKSNTQQILGGSQALTHLRRARENIEAVDVASLSIRDRRSIQAEFAALAEALRILDVGQAPRPAGNGLLGSLRALMRR